MIKKIITSEAVSEGHPDKVADAISDAILDACLEVDEHAKVACEVLISNNSVIIAGEITCKETIDYVAIAKKVISDIGYNKDNGFDVENADYSIIVQEQSLDIAHAVNKEQQGAGDQGIMYGYACDETKNYLPLAHVLANEILLLATKKRKSGEFKWAGPDMKSQVSVSYGKFKEVTTVLISVQHDTYYDEKIFKQYIKEQIVDVVLREHGVYSAEYELLINPSGRFVIGGPKADTGLTGRKIIVDTYGGFAKHGGGAFSGKDPSKVDRAAAYYLRYVAKNIVASGIASKCEIQISYAIGKAEPISINVDTFFTGKYFDVELITMVKRLFDFTPENMIKHLDLLKIKYLPLSSGGHFGRLDLNYNFEKIDKVSRIKKYFKRQKI